MLKTKVFLTNITNLSDARYAAGMGVDYIGFAINPESKQYVTSEQVQSITEWVSGVSIIGDIGSSDSAQTGEYPLDFILTDNISLIELSDNTVAAFILSNENKEDIKFKLETVKSKTPFVILKVDKELLTQHTDYLKSICQQHKILLATGLTPQNIALILHEINPEGIVIYGSTEEKPGLSSYDGIADILEEIEEE